MHLMTFDKQSVARVVRASIELRIGGRIEVESNGSRHSSSERSECFVRFEPNVRSERVRYFSERETNVQALKRLINLIALK